MQCCAAENLVKEDSTLHRSSTKRCTESMEDKLLMSIFFFNFRTTLNWTGLNCLILHVSCSVEEKTCFIQFSLKTIALNFRSVFLTHLVYMKKIYKKQIEKKYLLEQLKCSKSFIHF